MENRVKNGFTFYDILIVVAVLAVSALIVIPKVSNALDTNDNKDEVYNEILNNYLLIAEKYGNDKKDEVKDNSGMIISIDDLIKEGYLHTYQEDIIDIRDNTTKMNNIKFSLIYDEENDNVYAQVN